MSAIACLQPKDGKRFEHFDAPCCHWNPEQLLAYFQGRRHVRYFAITDAAATTSERPDAVLYNRFEFDGEVHQLPIDFDWCDNPGANAEWLLQLHRFGFAVALGRAYQHSGELRYRDKWVELTRSWIAKAQPVAEPVEVSAGRLQNWIFAYRYFIAAKSPPSLDAGFHAQLLAAVHRQAAELRAVLNPAKHDNVPALHALFLTAVVFPEFTESGAWRQFAIEALLARLRSRAQGGSRSASEPVRSELALALAMRRLALLNRIEMPADLDACIREILDFNLQLLRPDGRMPALAGPCGDWLDVLRQACDLYNDPALIYAASRGKQGRRPAYRADLPERHGYAVLRSGAGDRSKTSEEERYLLLDCGSPEDALNRFNPLGIEVYGFGHPLIVDPAEGGVADPAGWRQRRNGIVMDCRSTPGAAAADTAGLVQSLRVALHRPELDYLHGVASSPECPVIHERKILFVGGDYWLVCDLLRAEDLHDYDLLFHLNPGFLNRVNASSDSTGIQVDAPNLVLAQPAARDVAATLETGPAWLASAGRQTVPVARFSRRAARCCFYTVLYPYRTERPGLIVGWLPVASRGEQAPVDIAAGLSILHRTEQGLYRDEIYLSHLPRSQFQFGGELTDSPFRVRRLNAQGELLYQHDAADSPVLPPP